jgi:multiple sugar transport system substrate-binding protein
MPMTSRLALPLQYSRAADRISTTGHRLYAESVADISDVAEEVGKAQGGYYDVSRLVAHDGKKWIALPWALGGGLLTNRKSWWAEIGYSDGKFPETWDEYRAAG